MTIQDILNRKGSKVFTIPPTTTIKNAADRMRVLGVAALVVNIDHTILGIVTERDVVVAASRLAGDALSMPVTKILPLTMVTIAPGDSVKRAMSLMTLHRVRHLPVIADERLVGIISIGDVVKSRLEDLEMESNVLRDIYVAVH